jgi:hypothetical protein
MLVEITSHLLYQAMLLWKETHLYGMGEKEAVHCSGEDSLLPLRRRECLVHPTLMSQETQ